MITLSDIRDWLKTISTAEHYYVGKLDNKQDKSIGVYTLKRSGPPVQAIGQKSTYNIIGISVLIHWNNNANDTEKAARQLYDKLLAAKNLIINKSRICAIILNVPEPIDVGSDDHGIYERVIEFEMYYERKDI